MNATVDKPTAQTQAIPEGHTAAIFRSDGTVYASGNMKEMRGQWECLPFILAGGMTDMYTYALLAVDGKWYRASWMQC